MPNLCKLYYHIQNLCDWDELMDEIKKKKIFIISYDFTEKNELSRKRFL